MTSQSTETEDKFVSASLSDSPTPEIVVIGNDDIAAIIRGYASDAGYNVASVRDIEAYVGSVSPDETSKLVIRSVSRSMLKDGELHLDERLERDDVPILAISGLTLTEAQVKHTEANIVGWLTKPFGRADLVQKVEESIKRVVESGETRILPNSEGSGRDDSGRPSGGKSGRAVSSNGHDPRKTTDVATTATQTSSKRDELAGTVPDVGTESHGTPARSDEMEAAFDRIEKLERKQEATTEDIEAVSDQIPELSRALTMVSERLDALDDRVEDLDERADAIKSDVIENQEEIEPLLEGMDTLVNEQLRLTDEIDATTREQAELRSTVEALTEWRDDVSIAFRALQTDD